MLDFIEACYDSRVSLGRLKLEELIQLFMKDLTDPSNTAGEECVIAVFELLRDNLSLMDVKVITQRPPFVNE